MAYSSPERDKALENLQTLAVQRHDENLGYAQMAMKERQLMMDMYEQQRQDARKQQQGQFLGTLGGLAGMALGGPMGAMAGGALGNIMGGGGQPAGPLPFASMGATAMLKDWRAKQPSPWNQPTPPAPPSRPPAAAASAYGRPEAYYDPNDYENPTTGDLHQLYGNYA